jgi:KUP system potassium uptake protein
MVITTILAYFVSRDLLGWSPLTAGAVTAAFLVVDVAFFGANMFKVADGGWFPLVIAAVVFTLMTTWRRGRQLLNQRVREKSLTSEEFLESLRTHAPVRVPGTAVFLSHLSGHIPDSLLHSLEHYKVLHEQVLILTVVADEVSRVDERGRVSVEPLGEGMFRVVGRYGYMEHVDIPRLLEGITDEKLKRIDPMDTTYILGVHRLIVTKRPSRMARWQERVFASMMKNATSASNFFGLPPGRVVELGAQMDL